MQRLDDVELRRLRAKSQLLDRQDASADAVELVRAVVSIQAQDRGAAALTMRARIGAALAAADVKDAVCERDRIVLTWSFRGTLHYHHASDVRAILQLIGPTFGRESARHRQLGVGGRVWDEARDTLLGGLTAIGPMTRPQVRDLLAPVGVVPGTQATVHVLHRAAMNRLICLVPQADGPERISLFDDWIPAADQVDSDDVVAANLARRYLAAFGPATLTDFKNWSGLSAPKARLGWDGITAEMTEFDSSVGTVMALSEQVDHLLIAAKRRLPTRLVGGFDQLILGYKERRPQVDPEYKDLVNHQGGIIRPLVVADGQIVATWAVRRAGVETFPFADISPAVEREIAEESSAVLRFLAAK